MDYLDLSLKETIEYPTVSIDYIGALAD